MNSLLRKWIGVTVAVLMTSCVVGLCGCAQDNGTSEVDEEKVYFQVSDDSHYLETITEELTIVENIVYATAVNENGETEELVLDMYLPTEEVSGLRPAVLLVHGGGLTGGDKSTDALTKGIALDLAKMGYATFSANHRLAETATQGALEDACEDITAAFTWIQDNSVLCQVDPNFIAIGGYSSGALISLSICYSNEEAYKAVSDSALGVIDIAGGKQYFGKPKAGNAPCLIIHGTKDTTVAYSDSEATQKSLIKKDIEVTMYPIEGLNHILTTRYDDVRNQITMFLYKQLTGRDVEVKTTSEVSPEYLNVETRKENGVSYLVQQIDFVGDGTLSEWTDCEIINLNQLKDAGDALPTADDFTGTAMLGWGENQPGTIYIAATITDDVIQDQNASDGKWYKDDCLELVFDLSENGIAEQLMKWVIAADGGDLSVLADKENTQVFMKKEGNTTTYEILIDLNKIDSSVRTNKEAVQFQHGESIGFSISYNDGENGDREHQIGWTKGKSSDRTTLGTLLFQ